MQNNDHPHLPAQSWGGETLPVPLLPVALAPRVWMQRSRCRAIHLVGDDKLTIPENIQHWQKNGFGGRGVYSCPFI